MAAPLRLEIGHRAGNITVIGGPRTGTGQGREWECECDCGVVFWRSAGAITFAGRLGRGLSCGCLKSPPVKIRFMAKVRKTETCWEWTAGTHRDGYGLFRLTGEPTRTAHRVAYELFVGSLTDEQFVLHRCDNPKCVRPDHLFLGTQADNVQDMAAKGRGHWQNGRPSNRTGASNG